MNVVIIDYGMGNIKSLMGALKYVGATHITVDSHYETLNKADKLIIPGVGSFAKAIQTIKEKQLDIYLKDIVMDQKKPILGICLGMQLMCMSSTEQGENAGFGFIDGYVSKFNDTDIKVPHIGFNQVEVNNNSKLYHNMSGHLDFYFIHSFRMKSESHLNQCHCNYGGKFIASYELNNIAGVQFHPELSQNNGLKLIKNFIEKF